MSCPAVRAGRFGARVSALSSLGARSVPPADSSRPVHSFCGSCQQVRHLSSPFHQFSLTRPRTSSSSLSASSAKRSSRKRAGGPAAPRKSSASSSCTTSQSATGASSRRRPSSSASTAARGARRARSQAQWCVRPCLAPSCGGSSLRTKTDAGDGCSGVLQRANPRGAMCKPCQRVAADPKDTMRREVRLTLLPFSHSSSYTDVAVRLASSRRSALLSFAAAFLTNEPEP